MAKKSKLKKIFKKEKIQIKIPEKKIESILEDKNRFFKNEMGEAKKSFFFS